MTTEYDKVVREERQSLGLNETLGKITPTEAGLTGPHSTNNCIDCTRFVQDGKLYGRCTLVFGQIAADATCDYFVAGKPKDSIEPADYGPALAPEAAGYCVRPDGFHCEDCLHYDWDLETGEPTERCQIVAGPIERKQCCRFYAAFFNGEVVPR